MKMKLETKAKHVCKKGESESETDRKYVQSYLGTS